ncbi:pyridoxamine 5'-phosphate oxidase family protein [Piscinibacter sakaiensis]|uniref:pyridoxamine 5'-phosphate oxidase family protein n=1 Tax=Piscinibacter sakaiensis TaxID=1547922 RepID=UPI003AAE6CE8
MPAPDLSNLKTDDDRREHLWSLIKDIRFAMFTSRHSNGHLHSRPMTVQNKSLDQSDTLWFFMSRRNDAVADLASDPAVNIAFADPGDDSYVSIAGNASVVEDPAKKQQLWSAMAKAWFPGGPEDPDLALVGVRVIHADYWDVKSNKLVQLLKMAKAAVTGDPPTDMGEHEQLRMR